MEGINYITDDKGNTTGILLDLIAFRKRGVTASEILNELSRLQELIDKAATENKGTSNWATAKEKLKNLKT